MKSNYARFHTVSLIAQSAENSVLRETFLQSPDTAFFARFAKRMRRVSDSVSNLRAVITQRKMRGRPRRSIPF
jgi:hypothetical protein